MIGHEPAALARVHLPRVVMHVVHREYGVGLRGLYCICPLYFVGMQRDTSVCSPALLSHTGLGDWVEVLRIIGISNRWHGQETILISANLQTCLQGSLDKLIFASGYGTVMRETLIHFFLDDEKFLELLLCLS